MQYNQPTPLPVPADQILSHQMLQGQVGHPPATPMANRFTPQNLNALHHTLINSIQMNAQRSPLRTFMFNLFSMNGYNNPQYAEVFNTAAEYYFMVLNTAPNTPLQNVVETTLMCEMANLTQQYPALLNYIAPQQQAELQQYLAMKQQIGMQLMQFYNAQQQPNPAMMAYQQPMPQHPAAAMQYGVPAMQQPGWSYQQPMPYGQPLQPRRTPQVARGGQRAHVSASGMLRSNAPQYPQSPVQMSNRPKTRGTIDTTGITQPIHNTTQKGEEMRVVDQTTREMSHMLAREGQKRHEKYAPPIDRGGISFSFNRYKPARRPDQAIVGDGNNNYALLNEEEAVNYRDHESDHKMIKLAKSHHVGPKVLSSARWEEVSKPNEVDLTMKDTEEAKTVKFKDDDPLRLVQFVQAYSLHHAHVTAADALHSMGVEYDEGRVFEYYANIKTPMMIAVEDAKDLEKLAEANSLGSFVSVLGNLADEVSPYLWNVIHDRCTDIINRRIQAGLGVDITIDSLVGDYDDLMEALRDEVSDAALDRFKDRVLLMLRSATKQVADVDFECLIEPVSVTHLPWSSEELNLVLESEYSMLTVEATPDFAAAATRIVARGTQENVFVNRHLVVTADNVWVELHQSDLNRDTILVSPYRPQ